MATKTPMGDRNILGREIRFECSKTDCNGPEMTDKIEAIVNKDYVAFYQE